MKKKFYFVALGTIDVNVPKELDDPDKYAERLIRDSLGSYKSILWCDGNPIHSEDIVLREIPLD